MTEAVINHAAFAALQQTAGVDFVKELVATFLTEAPLMLDDLRRALAAREADRFRRAAHSLKSNSLTFGALKLGAMARELELGGIEPVIAAHSQPLDALALEYARAAAALTALSNA